MTENVSSDSVPIYKGYVPLIGKMAYRRLFVFVAVPLLVFTVIVLAVRAATPAPPREKLPARALSGVLAQAMLKVRSASVTSGDTNLRVDRSGNFQLTKNVEHGSYSELVSGTSVYFRADRNELAYLLTVGSAPLSSSRAATYAASFSNRWFTTGRVASGSKNPPVAPVSAGGLYQYLTLGAPGLSHVDSAVTDQGQMTIPLTMGSSTWFVPTTGPARPVSVSFLRASTSGLLNYDSGASFVYGTGLVTAPRSSKAPPEMAAAWNSTFGAPRFDRLTYLGLLYVASH